MTVNKILIIQGAKLGDMVCTTPVFRAVKSTYPESHLYVSGDKINKFVLEGNPNIDEYILIDEISVTKLRSLRLDAAVLLNPNPPILFRLLLSRVPKIIAPKVVGGFSPYMSKLYRILLVFVKNVPHRMHHYAPGEYLKSLEPIGIFCSDTKKDVYVQDKELKNIDLKFKSFKSKTKIAICPTAGNKIKEWPVEKFIEVANQLLLKENNFVVLVGGPNDKQVVERLISGLKSDQYIDTVGSSIEELKAIIKNVDIFVSADTGPIYISEAFGIPTVDIVGPVDEREQPPIGPRNLVVLPPDREEPELFVMNARVYDEKKAEKLAHSTKVEDVISSIEKLIK